MAVPLKSLARKTSSQEPKVQRVAACAAKKPLAFLQGKFLKHKMDDTAKVWLAKL